MKVGDLVIKVFASNSEWRDKAGLGIVISERNRIVGGYRYKVLWSNNYGTFWSPRNKLELLNEDW